MVISYQHCQVTYYWCPIPLIYCYCQDDSRIKIKANNIVLIFISNICLLTHLLCSQSIRRKDEATEIYQQTLRDGYVMTEGRSCTQLEQRLLAFPVFTTQECRSFQIRWLAQLTIVMCTFLTPCTLKIFKGLPSLLIEVILYTEDVMYPPPPYSVNAQAGTFSWLGAAVCISPGTQEPAL